MNKNKTFSRNQVQASKPFKSRADEEREEKAFAIELKKIDADIKMIKAEVARRMVDVLNLEFQKELIKVELASQEKFTKTMEK